MMRLKNKHIVGILKCKHLKGNITEALIDATGKVVPMIANQDEVVTENLVSAELELAA